MTGLLFFLAVAASSAQASQADERCLKAVTFMEAGNQREAGISATRQVIVNRARKQKKSVCKIVRQKGQFSSVKRNTKLSKVKLPKKFLHKFKKASKMHVVGKEYEYFYRRDMKQPKWARGMSCKRVQDHFYCKAK